MIVFNNPEEAIQYYLINYGIPYGADLERKGKLFNSAMTDMSKSIILIYGPHQKRLKKTLKEYLVKKLEKFRPWKEPYFNFEEIYYIIKKELTGFNGIVTLYDISLLVGAATKNLPEKYVYITSSKVKNNAELILGISGKIDFRILKTSFPVWIQRLTAWQIEDFLCHVEIILSSIGYEFIFNEKGFKEWYFFPETVLKEIEVLQNRE